jgi:hypothetical protein
MGIPDSAFPQNALGAVAAGPPAVFWLYADRDGQWWVRREGETKDRQFRTKEEALSFLRVSAARCSSCRLILRTPPGAQVQEKSGWSPSASMAGGGLSRKFSLGWRHHLTGWLRAMTRHAGNA